MTPADLYSKPLSLLLMEDAANPKSRRAGRVPRPKDSISAMPDKRLPVPAAAVNAVYDKPHGSKPKRSPRG